MIFLLNFVQHGRRNQRFPRHRTIFQHVPQFRGGNGKDRRFRHVPGEQLLRLGSGPVFAQGLRRNNAFRTRIGKDRKLLHDLLRLVPEMQGRQAVAPDQQADLIPGIPFRQRPERIDRVGFSFPFALNIGNFRLRHAADPRRHHRTTVGVGQDLPGLVGRNRCRHKEDAIHDPPVQDVSRQSRMTRMERIKCPAEHGNFHIFPFSP